MKTQLNKYQKLNCKVMEMNIEKRQVLENKLKKHVDYVNKTKREIVLQDILKRLEEGAMVSYAQNFEDVILQRIFKSKDKGTYVDVGAFDPYLKSVTNFFYRKGWTGINVDLCEENIGKFKKYRPKDVNICVAIGSESAEEVFYIQPGTTRSTKLKELGEDYKNRGRDVQVETLQTSSLTDLLLKNKIREIDFLSVDVEGSELDVFKGLDFNKFKPTVILAEATYPETSVASWKDWDKILQEASYECAYFDGLNRFYVQVTNLPLKDFFKLPPNYFDNFIKHEQIICALSE